MKPASFEYHRATSLAEAVAVFALHGDEAKVLAGGQSLVPMLALRLTRFGHLVDLAAVNELGRIERDNGHLSIGAMVTQAAIGRSDEVARSAPLLARATPFIGHFQIRNRGTVGGSIAHADPAAEYPAVALALDAEVEATGPGGTRTIAAADLFESTWTTSLADDEILTAVRFPVWPDRSGFAVEEVARRHGDFALVGAVAAVHLDGDTVGRAAIALFGVGGTPVRATAAEVTLTGASIDGLDRAEMAQAAVADLDPPDDVHASGAYRRRVGAVLVERALNHAIEEARQ